MDTSLEITASDTAHHSFQVDTDTLTAGWNKIEFHNDSNATHFALIEKLPTGASSFDRGSLSYEEYFWKGVSAPFQKFFDDLFVPGTPREDYNRAGWPEIDLPGSPGYGFVPWFFNPGVVYYGGPGLTSPGKTATTTVNLDSGEYIIECYVKEEHGNYEDFHSYHGMLQHVTVEEGSGGREPRSTFSVPLTNDGMSARNHVPPGDHTIKVQYLQQTVYPNLVGHDTHLIKLDGTNASEVNAWMNWAADDQLLSDGSEPGSFIGGVQDINTGDYPASAYVDVTLEEGEYALVSEIPDPKAKGYLETFTVG